MIKKILPRFQGIIDRGRLGKKGILAFDLGSYSIKIAEVQIVKGEPILTNFVRGRTYKNVIINGIINDFQYLLSNIQNILDVFKSNTKIVNLSLSYDLVIFDSFKVLTSPMKKK
jgi:hypothetical protein